MMAHFETDFCFAAGYKMRKLWRVDQARCALSQVGLNTPAACWHCAKLLVAAFCWHPLASSVAHKSQTVWVFGWPSLNWLDLRAVQAHRHQRQVDGAVRPMGVHTCLCLTLG